MSYPLYRSLFSADRTPATMQVPRSHGTVLVPYFLQNGWDRKNCHVA